MSFSPYWHELRVHGTNQYASSIASSVWGHCDRTIQGVDVIYLQLVDIRLDFYANNMVEQQNTGLH